MKNDQIKEQINRFLPDIIALRHAIHRRPELRYEEVETADLVAKTLRSYGYEPTIGIAKTGVCAVLDSNKPGKTVAIRADMDALPIQEASDLPYRSEKPGLMHACGHDGHTATLLMAARVLKEYQYELQGKIKFIFQPAEEGGNGAAAMIKAGVLENPRVDAIFGYHNLPSLPKNKVFVREGCILAGTLIIEIVIQGVGGHSSAPDKTVDAVYVGSAIVQALQSIVSRSLSPFEPVVVSITQFHAGAADNVIPDKAVLRGSVRFVKNEGLDFLKDKLTQVVVKTADAFGAKAQINFVSLTPATINTRNETSLVKQTAIDILGISGVESMAQNLMATEDFSFYLNEIPGSYFLVGMGENKPYVHHPAYQFDDEIIPIAAEMLIRTALGYLS
ncbi:MAG: amidohydrolase [Gammaproteobacteria bacterium]|nr:amidohydrolase [Gammaproteobacteria bacterium]